MKRIGHRSRLLVLPVVLLACSATRCLAEDSIYHFYKGVHLSQDHSLKPKQVQLLLGDLRFLTGFSDLRFDSEGNLIAGDQAPITGGSQLARDLFTLAINGGDSFTLERKDRSPAIAFAQIESVADYADGPGTRHQDWHIRIDFADFRELRGDGAAISSFSPGIAVFHELIHAVLGYQDPLDPGDRLGQCERHLNRMRVELGLAEREYYYPQKRSAVSPESAAQIYQGSLAFVRQDGSIKRRKEFVITFNLDRIVDVDRARSVQSIQADLLARRTGFAQTTARR